MASHADGNGGSGASGVRVSSYLPGILFFFVFEMIELYLSRRNSNARISYARQPDRFQRM
jgi:hypothetical protein